MSPYVNVKVDEIVVKSRETLTVWFEPSGNWNETPRTQVELRITPDGDLEIFCNKNKVYIKNFKDWKSISP